MKIKEKEKRKQRRQNKKNKIKKKSWLSEMVILGLEQNFFIANVPLVQVKKKNQLEKLKVWNQSTKILIYYVNCILYQPTDFVSHETT